MRPVGRFVGVAAAMLLGAGLAGPVTSFAQRTFERPTADTGPIDVRQVGPIDARLVPPATVGAMQAGLWSVALEGRPDVVVPAPDFLKRGEVFHFRWTAGQGETYRILEVRSDGWVEGELFPSRLRRWLNPAHALSIERANR